MTQSLHCLGCDPGLSDAFALLNVSTRKIEGIWDMPVKDGKVSPEGVAMIIDMAKSIAAGRIVAAVENVSSMPRQAGAFNFGRSAGVVHGVLGALGIAYDLVSPNEWKGACGLRRGVNETQAQVKTRARELASKLWPEQAEQFKRIRDDGRAESCLLSFFYAQKMSWV